MAVPVLSPAQPAQRAPEEKKESDIDRIIKALQIANYTVGIGGNIDQIITNVDKRRVLEKELEEKQAAANEKENLGKRIITPLSEVGMSKEYEISRTPFNEGGSEWTDPQGKPIYTRPRSYLDTRAKAQGIKTDAAKEKKFLADANKASRESTSEGAQFNKLPKENQKQIEKLAEKNVDLVQIRDALAGQLDQLRDNGINEDVKIKTAEGMLKLLNSEVGKDAIGAEEAERLGSLIKFKIVNVREPGSFMGRDLDLFLEQVSLKTDNISSLIQSNADRIDRLRSGERLTGSSPLNEFAKTKQYNRGSLMPEATAGGIFQLRGVKIPMKGGQIDKKILTREQKMKALGYE